MFKSLICVWVLSPVIQPALHPAVTFQLSYCVLFLLYFLIFSCPFLKFSFCSWMFTGPQWEPFFSRVIFNSLSDDYLKDKSHDSILLRSVFGDLSHFFVSNLCPFLLLPYFCVTSCALDKTGNYQSPWVASCRKRPLTPRMAVLEVFQYCSNSVLPHGKASCCALCSFSVLSLRLGDANGIF